VSSLEWGSWGTGVGQCQYPEALDTDASGAVYLGETGRIQKFDADGNHLMTIPTGEGVLDLSLAPDGTIFTYGFSLQMKRYSAAGVFLGTFGPAFILMVGLDVAQNGDVYAGSPAGVSPGIRRYSNTGVLLGSWGSLGTGNGQFGTNDVFPRVGPGGDVYALDYGNLRVQKFTSTGVFLTKWGGPGSGDGQFTDPRDLAVDAEGNVYVAERGAGVTGLRVQKFDSEGNFLTAWGSHGQCQGCFDGLRAVAVHGTQAIYTAEGQSGYSRIQKFTMPTVSVPREGVTAEGFAPPFPNPGHGDVRLAVTLESGAIVDIAVHDVTGRVVARPVSAASWGPGHRTHVWTPEDLPAGLYHVRVRVGRVERVRKLVWLGH
jgi:DNA-binding beta-propeller fold protein YncE